MRSPRRLALVFSAALALVALAGCGSSSSGGGPSDAQMADALGAKMVAGHYAIDGNPFCSIDTFLHDSGEVSDASKTDKGHVIAAQDGTLGIVIRTPFAPTCVPKARDGLNKLARKDS